MHLASRPSYRHPLILTLLALAFAFGGLLVAPGSLIVDGKRIHSDETVLPSERSIGNDLTRLFLPHHLRIASALAKTGRLPQWDPAGFGGRPLVGNPQAGLWYPPVWLAWCWSDPAALGWITLAHLISGALGAFFLARRMGLRPFSSTVAAGVFALSPYLLAQTAEGHLPHVWAACWYPWAFLAARATWEGKRSAALGLAIVLTLTLLTGHPQEWYYLTVALTAFAVVESFRAWRRRQPGIAWQHMLLGCVAILFMLGLAAIELVPDAFASHWSEQATGLSLREASRHHIHSSNLLQLLYPTALGDAGTYLGRGSFWEGLLSFGWIALLLALVALFRSPRRSCVRAWSMLALAATVFAFGKDLGLFRLLYTILPGMSLFRVPARALFLTTLAMAMLAGLGLDAALDPPTMLAGLARRCRWLTFAIAGTVMVAAIFAPPTVVSSAHGSLDTLASFRAGGANMAHAPFFWVILFASCLLVSLADSYSAQGRRAWIALGVLALLELSVIGRGLIPTSPADRFVGPDSVSRAILEVQPPDPFRLRARDAFYPDLPAALHGFEKTNLNDYYQVAHAERVYSALYPLFEDREWENRFTASLAQAVLDRMNVSLLVTDRPEPGTNWPIVAQGQREKTPFWIFRNPTALPRAYVVPRAESWKKGDSWERRFLEVSPREAVLMASDPLGPTRGPRQPFLPAHYEAVDADRITIEVATDAPGLLVVADTWMPGWSATLDSRPAPILRGNGAQRVVPLPQPGNHVIRMRYEAPGLRAGMLITGLTGALWIVVFVWLRRREHPFRPIRDASAGTIRARARRQKVAGTASCPTEALPSGQPAR